MIHHTGLGCPMKCPICKREVDERERDRKGSPYPFCTERCKLVDLGRWLGGKYQIPVEEPDESDNDAAPRGPDA